MKIKLALVFIVAVAFVGLWTYEQFVPPFAYGGPVPDFSLIDTKGDTVRLSDLKGEPVIVHFWATWCSQCVGELPLLSKFNELYPGIRLLTVNEDEGGIAAVNAFFADTIPKFTILLDPEGRVSDRFKSYKVPESFLIDRNGNFVHRFIGSVSWEDPKIMASVNTMLSPIR